MPETYVLWIVVVAALVFDFINGWNDSANAIATVISTRVLTPLAALLMAALLNFAGAYLSTRVAKTIGGGLVDPKVVTPQVTLAAMLAASAWVIWCTRKGLPISGSHSLIGGLLGAAVAAHGVDAIHPKGLVTVLTALFASPVMGLLLGYALMKALLALFARSHPGRLSRVFGRLQIVSAGLMALSHGTNDAQKVMGVITLALVASGQLASVEVPLWVMTACAVVMALGTALGGYHVIRTLGMSLAHLRPINGFAAETAATAVLMGAAAFGVPVSTTHVITASIMGVGATRRLSAVRWSIGEKILYAWIFTFPVCALLSAIVSWLVGPKGLFGSI